jgi:anti-anti-sigma factor
MNDETRGLVYAMQIQFLEEGERLVARPQGRMDAPDGIDFASAVRERLHAGINCLTIDLEELEFINFGGIRAVLWFARSLTDGGRSLDFLGGNRSVRDALDQAGLDDFFPFTPPYVSTRGVQRWNVVNSSSR